MKKKSHSGAKKVPLHKKSYGDLTPMKKLARRQSLHALSLMRNYGYNLTDAAKSAGVRRDTILRHVGTAIVKRKGRYFAKRKDNISRSMRIRSNGSDYYITINGSAAAATISGYHNAVQHYLETGDDSKLMEYDGHEIKDSKGNLHRLETNKEKIRESEEKKEEREFYDIYAG